jgi:hypothetical protein
MRRRTSYGRREHSEVCRELPQVRTLLCHVAVTATSPMIQSTQFSYIKDADTKYERGLHETHARGTC